MTQITTKDLTLHAFSEDELDRICDALIVASDHYSEMAGTLRHGPMKVFGDAPYDMALDICRKMSHLLLKIQAAR